MDTNDFLQMFRTQEAMRQAEVVGLMYAAMMGGLAGMVPLIYGATKKQLGLGFVGFLLCIGAGYLGSLFFAGPLAAVFVFVIASQANHPQAQGSAPLHPPTAANSPVPDNALVYRGPASGEIPAFNCITTAPNTLTFRGSGKLLRKEGTRYRIIGPLPTVVTLKAVESVTYRIETDGDQAYETTYVGADPMTAASGAPGSSGALAAEPVSPVESLDRLKRLKDAGDLTQEEFNRLKRHVIESTS